MTYHNHIVRVPKKLSLRPFTVDHINVQKGDRVRRQQVLAQLRVSHKKIVPVIAPSDSWVRHVAVKEQAHVKGGDVLFIIDSMPSADYQTDATEVNNTTELGEKGRRKLERDGERKLATKFSAPLVNALEQSGNGHAASYTGVKQHKFLKNKKEGVPLKMSEHAAKNQKAINKARNDPALQKQMNNQLQKQLGVGAAPSSAPTLKA